MPPIKKGGAPDGAGWGRLKAAGCVEGLCSLTRRGRYRHWSRSAARVQRVQKVQRVVDCPAGDEYKVSVTGFALVSPVPHDEEQKPPSPERGCRRQATEEQRGF